MCSKAIGSVVLVLLAAGLAACGGSGTGPITPPPDTSPPTVEGITPASGATSVAPSTLVTVTFSEVMAPASLTAAGTFTVAPAAGGAGLAGVVSYADRVATFTPLAPLPWVTALRATVSVAATDLAGNHLAAPCVWTFTTAPAPDLTPPTVSGRSPGAGATGVAVDTVVAVTFSEVIDPGTVGAASLGVAPRAGAPLAGGISVDGAVATFTPALALAFETTYDVTVGTGVQDLAGNALAAPDAWSFTTSPAPGDVTPPHVVAVTPADGAVGSPVHTVVSATFDEPVDPSTVDAASFRLEGPGGVAVPATLALSALGTIVTLTPSSPLAASTTYTARAGTAIHDLAGNALAAPRVWSFTTGAPDLLPPFVQGRSPWAEGVPVTSAVAAVFSEDVDPASLTSATFRVADGGGTPVTGTVSVAGRRATFVPTIPLAHLTSYGVTVSGTVTDLAGNPMGSDETWTFRTGADALDATFGVEGVSPSVTGSAAALAVAPGGKLVVAGTIGDDGHRDLLLARFDASGALDPGFGGDGLVTWEGSTFDDDAHAVLVQPDGKVVAGGCARTDGFVLRVDEQGVLDPGFAAGGVWRSGGAGDCVLDLALQPDGKILAVGYACTGGTCSQLLLRLRPDGSPDPDFGTGGFVSGESYLVAVALQGDGILVGDRHGLDLVVRRHDGAGGLDASFGTSGTFRWSQDAASEEYLADVAVDGAGRIFASDSTSSGVVLRTTSAGQLDPAFGTAGVATTSPWQNEVLVVDASGRAHACSSRSDGGTEAGVLRLDGGGGLDPTFAESGAFGWRPGFTHGTLCRAMVLSGGSPVFAADQRRWMEDLSVVHEFVLVRLR